MWCITKHNAQSCKKEVEEIKVSPKCDSNYLTNFLFFNEYILSTRIIQFFIKDNYRCIIFMAWGKINYDGNVYFYIYTDTLKLIDDFTSIIINNCFCVLNSTDNSLIP